MTANAVVGQMDIFLSNGFDDFISKPIDTRQLNVILKKYVRDKQPAEVIEAARRQAGYIPNDAAQFSSQLMEAFVRDAVKTVEALETIYEKRGAFGDEDIQLFTINVHGAKSALANVGESSLSVLAGKLEQAGRENDTALITAETPAFLDELRAVIVKLAPQKQEEEKRELTDGDYAYLREKLHVIKEVCEVYDKITAKETITGLRQKPWPPAVRELLDIMAGQLLSGDFEEVSQTADKIVETGMHIDLLKGDTTDG